MADARLKVLFIDDDQHILSGLKRMLYLKKLDWETVFCDDGDSALKYLEEHEVDVVVTDMRMPQMSGFQFLAMVKKLYPEIIRIVLSGYSETELVVKSVMVAHCYLHKPCTPAVLIDNIIRADKLRKFLKNETLRKLLNQTSTLPSLPHLYQELMSLINNDGVNLEQISEVIKKDIGMSAKILQVVNSSFFGYAQKISSIQEAISIVGLETVKSLILIAHIFQTISIDVFEVLPIKFLWDYSVKMGQLTKLAVKQLQRKEVAEDSFTAGLLSRVGIVILATNFFEDYQKVLKEVRGGRVLGEVEREVFGVTHSEVGGYLLSLWGLPNNIVEAVIYAEDPSVLGSELLLPVSVVHFVQGAMNYQLEREKNLDGWLFGNEKMNEGYLNGIGIEIGVEELLKSMEEQMAS